VLEVVVVVDELEVVELVVLLEVVEEVLEVLWAFGCPMPDAA